MNSPLVIAKVILLALFIALCATFVARTHATSTSDSDITLTEDYELNSQAGFYDLLSQKEEVYDVKMFPGDNSFVITFTTPADEHFMLKGKMNLEPYKDGKTKFSFIPLYYNSPEPDRLIDSLIDGTRPREMLLSNYKTDDNQVIISQNGLVFVHPKAAKLDYIAPTTLTVQQNGTTVKP